MKLLFQEDHFLAQSDHHELTIHANEELGFRPFQLLVSSVAGCSALVLKKILDKMRLAYEDLEIAITTERNEDQVNRVERIHLHYKIKGNALSESKIERALQLTRENCSIVQSVQDSITVTESFELVS